MSAPKGEFYCRYYVGHKGKFGHEFLEFEFTAGGQVELRLLHVTLNIFLQSQSVICIHMCRCDMRITQTTKTIL